MVNNRRARAAPKPVRWLMPAAGVAVTLLALNWAAGRWGLRWDDITGHLGSALDDDSALAITERDDDSAQALTPAPQEVLLPNSVGPLGDQVLTIEAGQTIGVLLRDLELPEEQIGELVAASATAGWDLSRKLRAGSQLHVWKDEQGRPQRLGQFTDPETWLTVQRKKAGWTAALGQPPWQHGQEAYVLRIETSLWDAAMKASMDPADANLLAALFDREVRLDSLSKGDRIVVLFETLSLGEVHRSGELLASRFRQNGQTLERIPWPYRDQGYRAFDPEGSAREYAFLRAPIDSARMSSDVGRRYHPVLKRRAKHQGIDYPAPWGTPVRAVADGTVTLAGPRGGYGNLIEIQHEGGYRTRYGHLSSIKSNVVPGAKVARGKAIGAVGSTGRSTGAHLHFELRKGDRIIPPNSFRPKPIGTVQLEGAAKEAFLVAARERLASLNSAEAKQLVEERRALLEPAQGSEHAP